MNKIDNNPFEITLEPGEYLDRFSVTFKADKKNGHVDKENLEKSNTESSIVAGDFSIHMNNTTSELQITKPI